MTERNNIIYPELEIHLSRIRNNAREIVCECKKLNVSVCGVVKGVNGNIDVANVLLDEGCREIGDSRLHHLKDLRKNGFNAPLLLTRIPMLSEIEELVNYVDISLNSEIEVIKEINRCAKLKNKIHKVILMCDLGDLREGYFDKEIVVEIAEYIEEELEHIELLGVGTNLGCYGSIKPTMSNMEELVEVANRIEIKINRKLDVISGGATSTLPLVFNNSLHKRINHLRIGEGILLASDLLNLWRLDIKNLDQSTIILNAELIELKDKPTYPVGEIFIDAFGNRPDYVDYGNRKRGILAVGKQDFGFHDKLIPIDKNVKIIGSSSDHLIVDLENTFDDYSIGDILSFQMYYGPMLYLTSSDSVKKKIVY